MLLPGVTNAQKTSINRSWMPVYRTAMELLQKEKFGSSREFFRRLSETTAAFPAEMHTLSMYYQAYSGLELFHADAAAAMLDFIRTHPENPKANLGYIELGRYYFKKKQYAEALSAFSQVNADELDEDTKTEASFKKAYCLFITDNISEAKTLFYTVKEKEGKYQSPALYYYAHISYIEKNYETALRHFNRLKGDENYGRIVPYYITQIYYLQKKYDELLMVAPPLLDSAGSRRAPEIARMIAEAYFHTQRYAESLPYYARYLEKTTVTPGRTDYYTIAYAHYRSGKTKDAIELFNKVETLTEDSLTQATYYHLADCYLISDNKAFAMNMFRQASTYTFDPVISENALFNYAKLAYETGFNPYGEAGKAFTEFLDKYPSSDYRDEALEYMSDLYLSSKNYREALESLEKIKKRDARLNAIYQKVAWFRAVELFNNSKFEEAIGTFDKSLKHSLSSDIEALSLYWKAEAYYRLEDYSEALDHYVKFQKSAGSFALPEFNMAYYNIGYCHFKKKEYGNALTAFRKFISSMKDENKLIVNDAYIRTADCFFMTKDYTSAIEFYDKSIAMKQLDGDYALYQKSLAQGVLGRFEAKAATLIQLVQQYTSSVYRDDALFELGNTFQTTGNNAKAIDYYDQLRREYPNCGYIARTLLRIGLILFNEQKDAEALAVFKQVVSDFPGSAESREALVNIRNVYVDMDRIEEFFVYVKEQSGTGISESEQDSLTYIAAQNKYMSNDCQSSISGFRSYLDRYPRGIFIIDASFYLAECLNRTGNAKEAAGYFEFVVSKPRTKFTESSLVKLSEIYFASKDYESALKAYAALENQAEYSANILMARTGSMRCLGLLSRHEEAIQAANNLLATEKLSDELVAEARLVKGRSALALDSISLAQTEFLMVSRMTKSEMGAEAKYYLGFIQHKMGQYAESEKIAFDLINQVPSYDYWVARAFILLSDNYLKTGNIRQAKYTLQSIIENYEGEDLVKLAQEKLNLILENERLEEQRRQEELLKTQDPQNTFDQNKQ